MGIISTIKDSLTGNKLHVGVNGSIEVVERNEPPREAVNSILPFRSWFTDSTDSNDMSVNGSVTPVIFSIRASEHYDIYIRNISADIGCLISAGTPSLNKFGNVTALTNGLKWVHFTQSQGEYLLHDGIKTGKAFIRIAVDTHAIGTGTEAFLADVSGAGSVKSYLPIIDMEETFGLKYGLKLKRGSTDRIDFIVQDDLTALDTFNIVGHGFRF